MHPSLETCQSAQQLSTGCVDSQRCQGVEVRFVEQAHRLSDGLPFQRQSAEHVLEHADVADAQFPVLKTRGIEYAAGESYDFRLGERARGADYLASVLPELPISASLRLLVAETGAVVAPAGRFGNLPALLSHHAHHRGGQLGPECQIAVAAVLEGVELVHDRIARLGGEQFQPLKGGRGDTRETTSGSDLVTQSLERQASTHNAWTEVTRPPWSLGHHSAAVAFASSIPLRSSAGRASFFFRAVDMRLVGLWWECEPAQEGEVDKTEQNDVDDPCIAVINRHLCDH